MANTSSKTIATTDAGARAELTKLKLAVVNFHPGDANKRLRMNICRDACYTSHNFLVYKNQQMMDLKTEIAALAGETDGEIKSVTLERKIETYGSMQDELTELTLRHEADLAVYEAVWEEKWRPGPTTKGKSKPQLKAKLKAILAE